MNLHVYVNLDHDHTTQCGMGNKACGMCEQGTFLWSGSLWMYMWLACEAYSQIDGNSMPLNNYRLSLGKENSCRLFGYYVLESGLAYFS